MDNNTTWIEENIIGSSVQNYDSSIHTDDDSIEIKKYSNYVTRNSFEWIIIRFELKKS